MNAYPYNLYYLFSTFLKIKSAPKARRRFQRMPRHMCFRFLHIALWWNWQKCHVSRKRKVLPHQKSRRRRRRKWWNTAKTDKQTSTEQRTPTPTGATTEARTTTASKNLPRYLLASNDVQPLYTTICDTSGINRRWLLPSFILISYLRTVRIRLAQYFNGPKQLGCVLNR